MKFSKRFVSYWKKLSPNVRHEIISITDTFGCVFLLEILFQIAQPEGIPASWGALTALLIAGVRVAWKASRVLIVKYVAGRKLPVEESTP